MRNALGFGLGAAFGLVALAGFTISEPGSELFATGRERVVTIGTGDYFFQAPDTIVSGVTTIRLENGGKELHHVQLVRLDEGHTLMELMDLVTSGAPAPAWAHMVGGPNTPGPGGVSTASLDLEPGNYGLICWVHGADGVQHFMKGMFKGLVVVPAPIAVGRLPQADAEMVLDDYSYTFSKPLQAGRRTIRVRNVAAQAHEVVLVQLAPGKSAHDVLAWIAKQDGPPPGRPVGGTTFLAHDAENLITLDLEPGRYGLLCFVADAKDGRPHFMHGMVSEIEVAPSTLAAQ
jgi:hypothetical protein